MPAASNCRRPSSFVNRRRPRRGAEAAAALAAVGVAAFAVHALAASSARNGYVVKPLISGRADRALVNAWGLAASPTGPWWTANEARAVATSYSGAGRKQAVAVSVAGGP